MARDIFQEPTKSIPKADSQIVRVPMDQEDIGGRKDHLPSSGRATDMSIGHVPNAGTKV